MLSSGSITCVVDKLEKKQLLVRKPCSEERRVTFAVITEGGKQLMDTIFPEHREAINGIFSGLKEKETLISLLKQLGFHAQELEL